MQRPEDNSTTPQPPQEDLIGELLHAWDAADSVGAVGGPGTGGPAAPTGEAVSTTCLAPFTIIPSWQFLACGVDSLDLSIGIEWGPDWGIVSGGLERDKQRAAGTLGVLSADCRYIIRPSGKPPSFAWHLEWPEFHLFLGKSETPKGSTPNGLVAINSKALWSLGVRGVVELVRNEITRFGGSVLGFKPSRCDLSADFLIPNDLTLDLLLTHRVPSHLQHSQHLTGNRLETFYQGAKKSPIQLRIYDKGLEVAHEGTKLWFLDVWKVSSLSHVWRVEFQLRRQVLRQFNLDALEDLEQSLGGLWKYLTEEWFSLRVPDDSNTTRRTVLPWWQAVVECGTNFGDMTTLQRSFEGEPADSSWYVSHCSGCLPSFAACEGLSTFEDAAALLFARMDNYWRTRDFPTAVTIKAIRLGAPPALGVRDDTTGLDNAA